MLNILAIAFDVVVLLLLLTAKAALLIAIVAVPLLLVVALTQGLRHPTGRRLIPALVIAFVLGGSAISRAQIICTIPCPVWDFTAILKTIAVNAVMDTIRDLSQQQAERLYKMSWRLQQFVPLARYIISPDDRPEWRIFDWFSDAVLVAKPYHQSLSYGDRNGDGFTAISLPHPDPADVLGGFSAEGASVVRSRMALIDLNDSAIIRSTDEAGLIRYHGRTSQHVVDIIQDAITKDDNEESATAVLDKISATRGIGLRDQEDRQKLRSAQVELATVDNIEMRDGMTTAFNSFINRKQDEGRTGNALVAGADVLATWELP